MKGLGFALDGGQGQVHPRTTAPARALTLQYQRTARAANATLQLVQMKFVCRRNAFMCVKLKVTVTDAMFTDATIVNYYIIVTKNRADLSTGIESEQTSRAVAFYFVLFLVVIYKVQRGEFELQSYVHVQTNLANFVCCENVFNEIRSLYGRIKRWTTFFKNCDNVRPKKK